MNRQRLASSIGVVVGIVGIVFVVRKVVDDWDEFTAAIRDARPAWLVVALVAGFGAIAGIGVNWAAIIRERGHDADLRWFFMGQLGKYVPGGIWPVVGQAELARRGGVPRGDAYAATALSMLATLLGAAGVCALGAIASPNGRLLYGVGLVIGLAAVAGALHWLGGRTSRELPAVRVVARWSARHVPVWICFTAVNVAAVIALRGPHGWGVVVDLAFVTCLSWMAGFVIIGLPGGLGVREAVFVSLMTAPLGPGVAVSAAVVGRLVSIVVDVAAAGGSVATIRKPWPGPSS